MEQKRYLNSASSMGRGENKVTELLSSVSVSSKTRRLSNLNSREGRIKERKKVKDREALRNGF